MAAWSAELRADIYALSLYRDDNNVPYRPALYLAYNTRSNLARERRASQAEGKWNLAYWIPPDQWVGIDTRRDQHGNRITDSEGRQALDAWILAIMDQGAANENEIEEIVIPEFAELANRVARSLHGSGQIRSVFGGDVPIIMHDDEWGEAILLHTADVNPPGAADEFLKAEVF